MEHDQGLTEDQKIHVEAMRRFEQVEDKEQRKLAIEDMRFAHVEGGQWDEDAITKRLNRPRFTINRVEPAIDQIVGDQRQNRTAIKVRPVSGGADEQTSKIFNGLIRNIESTSKATNSYDSAFDETVAGGFGGWRILTEYADDDAFEQDIRFKPVKSAASSLYFGHAEEYDKRDAKYAFLVTNMPKTEFEAKYPGKQASNFTERVYNRGNCDDWFQGDFVRVAEYWKKVPVTKQIALLSNGKVIDQTEERDVMDELALDGITVIKSREVKSHKVVMYLVNGNEVIAKKSDWAGKYIPLIPVYGKTHTIEGKTYTKGLVRDAKDPQRIYNYETSQAIETSALTPKDPLWYTPIMVAGHEAKWKTFNTKNDPFMPYNVDPKAPGPPVRGGAPALQQATLAMIAQASADIEATTGIHAASLGNAPQLLSEKSVQSQAEKGDRGSFIYTDNLQKSIQYGGEILIDLIPRVYDTARSIRVLNLDGTSEQVDINQHLNETITDRQTGKDVIVNDLTTGKYDIVVSSGPSFATKRQESASQLIELSAANPIIAQLGLDIIARNLDINDSDELHKRIREQMIKSGTVTPTDDEVKDLGLDQEQKPDPMQVALLENVQVETQRVIVDIENKEADTQNKRVITQQNTAKTLDTLVQTMLDKLDKGIPITNDELQIVIAQRDIVAAAQDELERESLIMQQSNSQNLLNTPMQ